MTRGNLPPQAYSKEDLYRAMSWLDRQSESVKSMATTMDGLMSMYKNALIYGDKSIEKEAPSKSDNFKDELKDIAQKLGSFSNSDEDIQTIANEPLPRVKPSTPIKQAPTKPNHLDDLSTSRLKELRARFNLSSDEEVLRMAIAFTYEKLQKL